MAKWGVKGDKGAGNVQSILVLTAAAASSRRAKVYSVGMSRFATPVDTMFQYYIQRCTTAGTGAALVPNALDPADTLACTIVAKDTVTVDPSLTAGAFLFDRAVHARSTYQWVAEYPGAEILIPATASNGVALVLGAASTDVFAGDARFEEQ